MFQSLWAAIFFTHSLVRDGFDSDLAQNTYGNDCVPDEWYPFAHLGNQSAPEAASERPRYLCCNLLTKYAKVAKFFLGFEFRRGVYSIDWAFTERN